MSSTYDHIVLGVGGILADLAVDGRTSYPITASSMDRPAVRDPRVPV